MRIIKKLSAITIISSIFLSNVAYSAEVVDAEATSNGLSSAISYGIDKVKNTVSEVLSIDLTADISNTEIKETKFKDPGMELKIKDIQALYDMGYELSDIEKAVELSSAVGKTPYEILQIKGQKQYIAHETNLQSEVATYELSDITENSGVSQECVDYDFTVEEKSWDSVLMELSEKDVVVDENQWELIKLSGVDKLIDSSMLSDSEKNELQNVSISNVANEASTQSASTSTSMLDMYNNYIFPKSVHEQINQGGYTNSDEIYANELTGNNIVKETDISLKGRNGLDLNLTRYYSVTNANDADASVYKASGVDKDKTSNYYAVCGNPTVTIYYNEPLSDGTTTQKKSIDSVYIAPARTNYNKAPLFLFGMFVDSKAYEEDYARLQNREEPQYMFTSQADAQECIQYAESGRYNYEINFGKESKIKRIVYDASDVDCFSVISLGRHSVKIAGDSYYNDMEEPSFEKYFDIGTGWAFDFPYIEKRYDSNEKEIYEYLHMGSDKIVQIEDNSLVDYYLKDIQLSKGSGKFNNETINYLLTSKDGKKYYFGTIGQLLGIEDRFGNKILFAYDKIQDGRFYYPRLTKITDSVGRVINISYQTNKVVITVLDNNDSTQNRVIEYNKTNSNLSSVKNAEGYITSYEYTPTTCNVSMVSKDCDDRPSKIKYQLLTSIKYPTGMKTLLSYNTMKKNCGIGGVMELPVFSMKKTGIDDEDGLFDERNSEYYTRDRGNNNTSVVYDGYPTFRSLKEVPGEYRVYSYNEKKNDDYLYPIKKRSIYKLSNNDNWIKESTFEACNDYTYEGELVNLIRIFTDYSYNAQELLTKETKRTYNYYDYNNNDRGEYVQTTKEYTYDSGKYGDVLSEKINGNTNYLTNYTYDSTYHIPTKITKKKDSSTTLVTNYSLTPDKKSISDITVTENNSTKKKRSYTYDSYGNVISEKRYTGGNNWNDYVEITYDYDDARTVSNKLNGAYVNKIAVSGIKDADGNPVSGAVEGTVSQSYTYDWYGNTASETDANGQTYQYSYDKLNRTTKVTNPDASNITYTFVVDEHTNDVSVKDAKGHTIKYSYDNFGNKISETDVTNNILLSERVRDRGYIGVMWEETQYSTQNGKTKIQEDYNSVGELMDKKVLDANDNILYHESYKTEYAVDNMLKKQTTTLHGDTDTENVKNIQYIDSYGNVVKEETVYTENGAEKTATTEYTYDYLGNVKTVREPRAKAENWSASQYTAKYDYDVDSNVIKETDINGKSIVNTYDGLGNLIAVTDKNGNKTTNTYDNLGRLLKEEIPFQKNGTSTVYAENKYYYDGNGNLTKSQTANNAAGSGTSYTTTEYTYNWQNQPTKVIGYNGDDIASCVRYHYDSVGNLRAMFTGEVENAIIYAANDVSNAGDYNVTEYTYDSMNRCTSQTDALGQKVTNTYDINGNLIKTIDRNKNTLSYTYDGLNQLTQKSSSKTADDTYTYAYNKKGLRTSMTGGGINTASVYNNLGQLAKETLTDGTVKEYTYDMNGNRKSFKLTKDGTVQYTLTYDYDKRNQLTKVYEDGTLKAEYTYNADGTLKKSSYGSQTTDYTYNLANLLTEVNNANGSTQISKYSYTYYVDGNQKSKTESVAGADKGITTYTYDGLNRLIQEEAPDDTYSYQYDIYGNRSQMVSERNGTTNYTYDKNNRLIQQDNNDGETTFRYDPNGNQISSMTLRSNSGGRVPVMNFEFAGGDTNSYSEYNSWNQLTRTMQNGKTASYTYNGDGLRMSKTVNGTTTSHIWDGTNIAGDVTGSTVTKYIRGLQLISSKNGSNENFYTYNGHGDVVQLTSGTGAITKQYSYDAFGVETDKADNDTNPFRYCGEYYDTETDSVYLRARYYRPTTGRFVTEDPIKDGLNWYVYGAQNPILHIDPSGMTFVPLRELMQNIGGSIYWNEGTGEAYIGYPGVEEDIPFYEGDDDGTYIDNGTMYASAEKVYYWLSMNLSNRDKAVLYGRIFGSGGDESPIRNENFKSSSQNCTNFVSQCLLAGGFQMDREWWYDFDRKLFNYWSGAWAGANKLFDYLVYTLGFRNVSCVRSGNDIANISYNVRPGDVIAWSHFDRVGGSGEKTHMAIVSEVRGDNIYYCGNTTDRNNWLLTNSDLWGDLYIVHVKYSDE